MGQPRGSRTDQAKQIQRPARFHETKIGSHRASASRRRGVVQKCSHSPPLIHRFINQMKTLLLFSLLAALSVSAADKSVNTLTDAEKAEGWRLLFDGKSTDGWRNFKKKS